MNHRLSRRWRKNLLHLFTVSAITALAIATAAPLTSQAPGTSRADAGLARSVVIGETVRLDASGSTDSDGDRIEYAWTLRTPPGSGARLSDPAAVRPQFSVDLLGEYTAELVVTDGKSKSETAVVHFSTGNVAPVAHAGVDRTIRKGQAVQVDASESSDFNGDALQYRWAIDQAPAGSRARFGAERASITSFTADRDGDYVLSLVVSDGRLESDPALVRLSTRDSLPQADSGSNRTTVIGAAVHLDGRGSSDADGDTLAYSWSLLHTPRQSAAAIDHAESAQPVLYADVPGLYVAQLVVTDGTARGAPDTVVIKARYPDQIPITPLPVSAGAGVLDTDGDGVPDDIDNCAEDANPTQFDSNGDGFGNRCDPDLDNDGFITNFGDLALFKSKFFPRPYDPDADFNEDGFVNFGDLAIFKSFFLGPPGPIAITFINPAGGDWHDPGNWSPPIVPNTTHTVRINLDPGVTVEYSTGASEIAGLRTSSPLLISGGELSVAGDALFNDTVTIQGGATLANANILPPTVMPAPGIDIPISQQVTFDGVTLGADVTVQRSANLTILNDLTVDNATITLASDNNFTSLTVSGANGDTSILDGTNGQIVFGGTTTLDNRNRVLVSGSGHNLSIGSGITVRTDTSGGQVIHANNNGAITHQGSVISNVSGRTVTLNGFPLTVEGSLQTLNDGIMQVNFGGTGSSITATGSASVNTGQLELFGDFTNDGTITATDGVLDIGNVVGDEWSNSGSITLSNATLELGGSFALADVGTATGAGTTVINGTFDNTGQTVDLVSALPGDVELATGAVVLGGTLSGSPLSIPISQQVTFDGVTLGADVTVQRSANLTILNDLTVDNATITLASDNNFTSLTVSGANGDTSILDGTNGQIVFGGTTTLDNRNRVLVSGSGHNLRIGSGITVRTDTSGGQVIHANNNGAITHQGSVISNVSGRTVTLNGFPLTVEGSLQTLNDGIMQVNFGGTGSSITATGSASVNTGQLELFGDFTNDGTITATDGVLDIGNVVGDEWSNTGSITLSNATLELGGSFALADVGTATGAGTTVINGTFDNTGQTVDLVSALPGDVELATGAVVLGGTLSGSPLSIPISQQVTFDGVTLGADVTVQRSANLTILNDLTVDNATITLASDNNFTSLTVSGANGDTSILDGTNGQIVFGGTTTLDNRNRVLVSGSGHNLRIGSGITVRTDTSGGQVIHANNNGAITHQGSVISNVSGRTVTLNGFPLTVEGSLQTLNDGIMQVNFGGTGSSITATGSASVNTGQLELFGDFTNDGTITATDGVLDIGNVVGDEWSNTGSITLSNATLELGGSFALADVGTATGAGTTVINGTFDNTGQTVDLVSALPGDVELATGAVVLGGTLSGSPLSIPISQQVTFDGVTLGADVTVQRSANLTILNGLTVDNATITLASDNNFTSLTVSGANGDTSILDGTNGQIVFGGTTTLDNRNRVLVSGSGHNLSIGSGITVRTDTSGGQVIHANNNGAITHQGSVISNVANRTVTLNGFPLTVEGSLQTLNDGIMQVNFGGTGSSITATGSASVNTGQLELFGDFTNDGTITATDGVLDIGNVVGDEWSNTGSITLSNATLELGGSFALADVGTTTGTGTTVVNGTFDNSGQTVDLVSALPGNVELATGAIILGGTLSGSPLSIPISQQVTFDGVTLGADVTVQRSANLTILNGLTVDNATITLASDNNFTSLTVSGANGDTSILDGTNGQIVFGGTTTLDNRNRVLASGSGHNLSIGSGITVRTDTSGGQVIHANNNGAITHQGSVISNVSGRTVTLNGFPLTVEGSLQAGAGSVLALGNYSLAASATLEVDVGGIATADFGRLTGSTGNLDGTLDIAVVNGFAPALGQTFEIMTFTTRNGTFAVESGTAIGGGLFFDVNYNATDVTLEVTN